MQTSLKIAKSVAQCTLIYSGMKETKIFFFFCKILQESKILIKFLFLSCAFFFYFTFYGNFKVIFFPKFVHRQKQKIMSYLNKFYNANVYLLLWHVRVIENEKNITKVR